MCCVLILAAILFAGCSENSAPSPATTTTTLPPTAAPVANVLAVTTTSVSATPVPTGAATPIPTTAAGQASNASVPTIFVNSTSNGDIFTIRANERVLVRLNENPTTGYSWNATVSKDLTVISDTYIAPNSTLVGAGGYHEWILAPESPGTYTFKAVYIRPWEGVSSAADTFSIVIVASPATE